MNKEFIQYTEALELKELGFDEPCFGYYQGGTNNLITEQIIKSQGDGNWCLAPLYQQAFRWFREKHKLDSMVQPTYSPKYQYRMFHIEGKTKVQIYGDYMGKEFNTYEETELACLIKLIEIVKNG